jgi:hypothetical protein
MTVHLLIGILFGVAGVLLAIWALSDFLVFTFWLGYEQGKKDAAGWWTQAAKDVEEMKQEIGTEEK